MGVTLTGEARLRGKILERPGNPSKRLGRFWGSGFLFVARWPHDWSAGFPVPSRPPIFRIQFVSFVWALPKLVLQHVRAPKKKSFAWTRPKLVLQHVQAQKISISTAGPALYKATSSQDRLAVLPHTAKHKDRQCYNVIGESSKHSEWLRGHALWIPNGSAAMHYKNSGFRMAPRPYAKKRFA